MAGFPDASLHTNRALPGPSPRGTSLTSTATPQPVFRRKARPHDCLLSSPFRSALGCHWLAADYIRTSFPLTLPFRAAQTGVHTALFLVSCLWVSGRPPRPPERASRSEEQCGDLGGKFSDGARLSRAGALPFRSGGLHVAGLGPVCSHKASEADWGLDPGCRWAGCLELGLRKALLSLQHSAVNPEI